MGPNLKQATPCQCFGKKVSRLLSRPIVLLEVQRTYHIVFFFLADADFREICSHASNFGEFALLKSFTLSSCEVNCLADMSEICLPGCLHVSRSLITDSSPRYATIEVLYTSCGFKMFPNV